MGCAEHLNFVAIVQKVQSIMKVQAIQVLLLLDLNHICGDSALLGRTWGFSMAPFRRAIFLPKTKYQP
jgi:hypothetical protein